MPERARPARVILAGLIVAPIIAGCAPVGAGPADPGALYTVVRQTINCVTVPCPQLVAIDAAGNRTRIGDLVPGPGYDGPDLAGLPAEEGRPLTVRGRMGGEKYPQTLQVFEVVGRAAAP